MRIQEHRPEILLQFYRSTLYSDDESVPKRLQSFSLSRQLITCSHEKLQRKMHFPIAVTEDFLVNHRKERVLDRRSRLPDFIQENHIGSRQITLHRTFVSIRSLQFLNAHRAEDFIGCRESRHQILKALSIPKRRLQLSGYHTLCHSRRSQQDDTLTCQSCQERERYLRLLLINAPVHLTE